MSSKLTHVAVRAAKPTKGSRREIPDGGTGLYLVVQPGGRKSWALRYRHGVSPRKLTLGPVLALEPGESESDDEPVVGSALTLGQARQLAAKMLRRVARGEDVAATKQAAKAGEGASESYLFGNVVETFLEKYARPRTRARSAAETERLLRTKVVSKWAKRPIEGITKVDVVALLDQVVADGAPVSANRVLAALRRMFNWLVERDALTLSPCTGVHPVAAETSRDRVLADDELGRVWQAAASLGQLAESFVKIAILTGQRRDEIAKMRWSELDMEGAMWRLPKERVKNGKAHDVPLSQPAVDLLKQMPRIAGAPDFVFTHGLAKSQPDEGTKALAPISGFSKMKRRLDAAIAELAVSERGPDAKADLDSNSVDPWVFHDLRRTTATGMAKLGVSREVVEKILNHQSGAFGGIVGVYQRHSYGPEKKDALDRWSAHVEWLTGQIAVPKPAANHHAA